MANGQLVAARLRPAGAGASLSFVLVRHEVFVQPDPTGVLALWSSLLSGQPPLPTWEKPGRLDYNAEPATVYSLYMHLGEIDQMNFDVPDEFNPGWLNRVLVRKKECDLAIDAANRLHPALDAIRNATPNDFSQPPPPAANRANLISQLYLDKYYLGIFLDRLAAGEIAMAPTSQMILGRILAPTAIRVLLGDFLGTAGAISVNGGTTTTGIRVEVFAPQNVSTKLFSEVTGKSSWDVPAGTRAPTVRYASEWARPLTAVEQAAAQANGFDLKLVNWWREVSEAQAWVLDPPPAAKLPHDGVVFHYSPLDFLDAVNGATWLSEWSKYRVRDAMGSDVPPPARPRSRRV
jgi:hypothetical protein